MGFCLDGDTWPDAIRIDMEPLPEVGRRLHMISVVAPVRVNRSPLPRFTMTTNARVGAAHGTCWR